MYKVVDDKGIRYLTKLNDDILIRKGQRINERMINRGYFTKEQLEKLIQQGRIEKLFDEIDNKKLITPINKKGKQHVIKSI